ncbi:SpoIIE family protein phosphatase [Thermomonospora umbrina]|uniref:Serine/threonine protein phosphatase PrpC n=1 Tax=Thermomonospora umbrina TaxID=111806 RepID=A0A3D9SP73_9ACTN|nr:SpoIIE family protein phosphatase [Thermomonospora umbrina]REE97762.1 serine/threonine protein phosphatase PrpC [Thermomonospora umbrina]
MRARSWLGRSSKDGRPSAKPETPDDATAEDTPAAPEPPVEADHDGNEPSPGADPEPGDERKSRGGPGDDPEPAEGGREPRGGHSEEAKSVDGPGHDDGRESEVAEAEGPEGEHIAQVTADGPEEDPTFETDETPDVDDWLEETVEEVFDHREALDDRLMGPMATYRWPEAAFPVLGDPDGLPAGRLAAELMELWPLLESAVERTGPGCLVPESLRWDEIAGWQLLCVPPYGARKLPVAETPGAVDRDRWAVVSALVTLAVGRPPRDVADALALTDLLAGDLTQGLDAIVRTVLSAGFAAAAALQAGLEPTGGRRIGFWPTEATLPGSRKVKGDPSMDNEDSAAVVRTPGGGLALLLCDGVTGPGDGSGARASRAAVRAMREFLEDDANAAPDVALGVAQRAVLGSAGAGASTAVVALLSPGGRARLASLGDSSAWLVRPLPDGGRAAWRLTPAHTELAERLAEDPAARSGGSMLVRCLGGIDRTPFTCTVRLAPGDQLVLLSDGAAEQDGDTWFGDDLAELAAAAASGAGRPAAALAAGLVMRSELLGGRDNATVVIADIHAEDAS